jgi:lysophospholipase L1-like esterase
VRWTTVNESSRFDDLNRGAKVINDELRTQAAERTNFGVIEWGAELAVHPEYLLADGIHHSPEGQRVFVQRLAAALRTCVQPAAG